MFFVSSISILQRKNTRCLHFINHFCLCVAHPGSNTGVSIHVAVSRELNGRIVLPSNTRTYRPRLPVASKPKKVVAAKADFQASAPAVGTSAVKSAEVGSGPTTPADVAALTSVGLPMDTDDADVQQKVARVQAEAQLPRLVPGPKQKEESLENIKPSMEMAVLLSYPLKVRLQTLISNLLRNI